MKNEIQLVVSIAGLGAGGIGFVPGAISVACNPLP